jgi:hypothetical protein
MKASGVTYAEELNAAYAAFGVAPAVMQAILDYLGTTVFPLTVEAEEYARQRASRLRIGSSMDDGGINDPGNNYMAMAWYLTRARAAYGGHWTPVVIYFGGGPVAERKADTVARAFYPKYERAWR